MRLVTLDEISTKEPFDCGDSDLNGFFIEDATNYQKQMLANTYVPWLSTSFTLLYQYIVYTLE